ncbi:SMP-30/gluconolactonase/LRE family protein [Achromobacter sp. GG226]|uniref:SMP-30/gluconolactonase/LRE family protein n=1 Tax=Verticiella alkaliphila TaxID=2779529 RepID=UPI001C0E0FB4|nr:SMP-30/gluconolactonase/LRE family protein [Verticiella sp. GG226]MBU4609396.1 SMP-30/gluconolactonase/LRE family protein [Verticiella sp. GG226]
MTSDITRFGTVDTALGECPIWDAQTQSLWLMDCRAGRIHRLDAHTGEGPHWELPPPTGSFALNTDGRVVVALKEEVALYDLDSGELTRLARIHDSHPQVRLNDGVSLADGSFVVGTMHAGREPGEAPLGGLYRLAPDGSFTRLAQGLGVVNGPRPTPHGDALVVADSVARKIYRYAWQADGSLGDPSVYIDTTAVDSAPDGACFDTDGGLWTALVLVGAIARFGPDGTLTHRIDLPVAHPASLCFGGPDLDELYVTTIRDSGRLRADGPLDGAVLRVRGSGFQGTTAPRTRIVAG